MVAAQTPADEIADGFFEALSTVAASHGLRCECVKLKEMSSRGQRHRTLGLLEGEGDSLKVHWLFYYKVSSAPKPDFWWGLTGKILDMMSDAACRRSARWGVVLLAGSPECGYLLEAQHVVRGRRQWSYRRGDDQYKVVAKYLDGSNSLHFGTAAALEEILELGPALSND